MTGRTLLLLAAGLLSACSAPATLATAPPALAPVRAPEARPARNDELDYARDLSNSFQEISRRVGPSVVGVTAVQRRGRSQVSARSQGSGVLVSEDGLVVTNFHVVNGAQSLRASLSDGRELEAEIVGTDPDSDLAVLKLDGAGFVAAPLETYAQPSVGEWVLAMGNPLGLGLTVTVGIVSGKGRNGLDIATYEDFIQTDAAINPGNSGGPLLNLDGHVIGINTAMGTTAGGSVGIGFAIPSHMVNSVLNGILEHGRVRRGWLGVFMEEFTREQAGRLGYAGPSRVAVLQVFADSPAEAAGLLAGDVLLSIDGHEVTDRAGVMNKVAEVEPGQRIFVDIWRRGERLRAQVTVGDRNRDQPRRAQ